MAIKKRSRVSQTVNVRQDADSDLQTIASEDEGVDFESIDTDVPREYIKAEQVVAFLEGNEGSTLHPKDEPVEKLLRNVQYVQNVGDPNFERMETFYRHRIRSPLTGIRAFCVMCVGGPKAANACDNTDCALWPFRSGRNAYYGKRK